MAYAVTITVTDSAQSTVIPDCKVWICSDLAGTALLFQEYTSTAGVATFSLDNGTYYAFYAKTGYSADDSPTTVTVASAAQAVAVEATVISLDAGTVDVVNFAICLLHGAINTDSPLLESWDEEDTAQTALPTLKFFKACYPRAMRKMQGLWLWPECERFPIPGAALDSTSAVDVPDWDYVYNKPVDCTAFWGVVSHAIDANTGEWQEFPFYEAGNQIACNVTNDDDDDPTYRFHVNLLVENTSLWSEELFQMTAHLLAVYTCRTLGADLNNQMLIKSLYDAAWSEAKAAVQARKYSITRLAQTGASPEVAPGIIDYKFPLPS